MTQQPQAPGGTNQATPEALSPPSPVAARKPDDTNLERQKEIWLVEQAAIAASVKILPDPSLGASSMPSSSSSWVRVVEETEWCQMLRMTQIESTELCRDHGSSNNNRSSSNKPELDARGQPLALQREGRFTTATSPWYFGGVDIGYPNPNHHPTPAADSSSDRAVAVYVILDALGRCVYRDHEWIDPTTLPPYISTFLAFREIGVLERLVRKQLETMPDLTPKAIWVDGNGIFHPRRAGLACFLGVKTGIPTIGIGKTLLCIGDNDDDDDGWTRERLDERIDAVLHDAVRRTNSGELTEATTTGGVPAVGTIWVRDPARALSLGDSTTTGSRTTKNRAELLKGLASVCNGIAIPLEVPSDNTTRSAANHDNDDDRHRWLGAALVGHGKRKRTHPGGSQRPIIVSVGHNVSLAEACAVTASLSEHRIPEPVREADLYGRELLRKRKQQQPP